MEFKGTKGEWILETVNDDVSGEVSEIYITQEGGGCIVCINDGDDNYDIETDLANAKLIAAAPELLEALRICISMIEMSYGECEATKIGQNAINKALK